MAVVEAGRWDDGDEAEDEVEDVDEEVVPS